MGFSYVLTSQPNRQYLSSSISRWVIGAIISGDSGSSTWHLHLAFRAYDLILLPSPARHVVSNWSRNLGSLRNNSACKKKLVEQEISRIFQNFPLAFSRKWVVYEHLIHGSWSPTNLKPWNSEVCERLWTWLETLGLITLDMNSSKFAQKVEYTRNFWVGLITFSLLSWYGKDITCNWTKYMILILSPSPETCKALIISLDH